MAGSSVSVIVVSVITTGFITLSDLFSSAVFSTDVVQLPAIINPISKEKMYFVLIVIRLRSIILILLLLFLNPLHKYFLYGQNRVLYTVCPQEQVLLSLC